MVVDPAREGFARRSSVPPTAEQIEQIAKDPVTEVRCGDIGSAQRRPDYDPDVQDEDGHYGRDEDKDPGDLGTNHRYQAEEFC